jgi:hypothetical protein
MPAHKVLRFLDVHGRMPVILQACDTLPGISASFNRPTLFLIIF